MKLLISDLDGTLYPKKDVQNPNQFEDNIKSIKKWLDAGNQFAVATARVLHHYPIITDKLGFDINYIGSNGAACKFGEETIIKLMPMQVYIDIANYLKENEINASCGINIDGKWYWSSKDCYPFGYHIFSPEMESKSQVTNLSEINPTDGIDRIQVYVPEEICGDIKQKIIDMNFDVNVHLSDKDLIDIAPSNASKGNGIHDLCERFKIRVEDVIVVGDSENDIAMFSITQHSYCIDHAAEHVLTHATYKVKSLQEAIERELGE